MYVKPAREADRFYNVTCMSVCMYVKPEGENDRSLQCYLYVCVYVKPAREVDHFCNVTCMSVCMQSGQRGWSFFAMLLVCLYVCMQSGQSGWSSFTVLLPAHRAPMKWQNVLNTVSTFSSRGGDQTYNQQTNAGQVPTVPSFSRLYPPPHTHTHPYPPFHPSVCYKRTLARDQPNGVINWNDSQIFDSYCPAWQTPTLAFEVVVAVTWSFTPSQPFRLYQGEGVWGTVSPYQNLKSMYSRQQADVYFLVMQNMSGKIYEKHWRKRHKMSGRKLYDLYWRKSTVR